MVCIHTFTFDPMEISTIVILHDGLINDDSGRSEGLDDEDAHLTVYNNQIGRAHV